MKIICLYPENERKQWEWLRWLPHVWNEDHTKRFLACTKGDTYALLKDFGEKLKARRRDLEEAQGKAAGFKTPLYFFLLASPVLPRAIPF